VSVTLFSECKFDREVLLISWKDIRAVFDMRRMHHGFIYLLIGTKTAYRLKT
jgi:hypothetical protein